DLLVKAGLRPFLKDGIDPVERLVDAERLDRSRPLSGGDRLHELLSCLRHLERDGPRGGHEHHDKSDSGESILHAPELRFPPCLMQAGCAASPWPPSPSPASIQ